MTGVRFLTALLACLVGALLVDRPAPAVMWAAPLGIASPVATPRALDLTAMMLTPAELGLPGAGLATHSGSSRMVFAEETFGDGSGQDAGDAGWRGSYEGALATLQAADASLYQELVVVRVNEYADAESAVQDFNAIMRELVASGAQAERSTTTFGDRSAVARWSGIDPDTGAANQAALIAFQVDALTADVTVFDFTDRSPDLAFLERLAAALLTKIGGELARGDVGVGAQALRLAGETVATEVDRYERRNGEVLPIAGQTGGWFAWRRDAYPGATEEYLVSQVISGGGTSFFVGRLVAFRDVEAASSTVRAAPARSATRMSEGAEILPLLGAETFGDESLTLTFTNPPADGRTFRGFLVVARVGAVVAEIFVESEQERPPLTTAQELMRAQVACIQSAACPDPVPIPSEPISLPTTGTATPGPVTD